MLHEKIPNMYQHPQFKTDVMTPLMMEQLLDREVVFDTNFQFHIVV